MLTAGLDRVLDLDVEARTIRVEAGVSLDEILRVAVPNGLWPAVTPGTRFVSVGGAIACDVHGKNHNRDGSIGHHLESLLLLSPSHGVIEASPTTNADVFWATVGGMGLTGVILEATLRLLPIETSTMKVEIERSPNVDVTFARMIESDADYRYSVAWVDCLARGKSLGRSVIEFADHAGLDELSGHGQEPARALRFRPSTLMKAPPWVPSSLLNRASIAAFNEFWFRKAPKRATHLVRNSSFFYPLDAVEGWNRIYGRRGFLQYQMVVPDNADATVRQCLELLSQQRAASFFAVLKRFGRADDSPLSFPQPGWTLALDLPVGRADLARLLDRLDTLVAEAGGRVYLAKDSRLRPDLLEQMYPNVAAWRQVRDRLDPERRMASDLSRRLGLLGARVTAGVG